MRPTRLAWAITAAVLLVGGTAACGADDDSDSAPSSAASGDVASTGASRAAVAEAPASGADDGAAPAIAGVLDRKIVFSASLRLEAEDIGRSFADVGRIAAAAGGFVEESSFAGAAQGQAASLVIRVPADRYQETLADLRAITGAAVTEESSRSEEVTEQYTDLASRQRNLERTEQQYLELQSKATTVPDILSLTARLDAVRLQIEQVKGRLQVLEHMTELATVSVTIAPVAPSIVDGRDGPPSLTDAFVDAWQGSMETARYVAAGGAYLAVAAAWLALPAGAVAFVAGRVLHRKQQPGA